MIQVKAGVKFAGLQPQIVLAITVAEHIWWLHGETPLVITSCNDGAHTEGSFHYRGLAVDLRTKNLPKDQREAAVKRLREALGTEFDVLFEGAGTDHEHCHVEHDSHT